MEELAGDELERSIIEARRAAISAGFDPDTPHELGDDAENTTRTSYAFLLSGIEDAPQLREIEEALERLEGVSARLVYPTATAWVTAPESLNPAEITAVIAEFGVTAQMSDSTLRRRAVGRRAVGHPMPRRGTRRVAGRMSGRMRRLRKHEEASLSQKRAAGFMRGEVERPATSQSDVLFTARDLVTPVRMWVAVALSAPVVALSYIPALQFGGWQWLCLALATPVALWCAWPFHRAMAGGVRRGISALDGASSIAVLSSYLWALGALVFTSAGDIGWTSSGNWLPVMHGEDIELFLDVTCGVTALLLIGRYNAVRVRSYLLEDMEYRRPDPNREYRVIRRPRGVGKAIEEAIPASELNRGDDVIVHPGDVIPVDGDVVGGSCRLHRPLIDAREPQTVKVGSRVFSGDTIQEGQVKVRVARTGHATRWAAVHKWVEDASRRENLATMLSTRSASLLIPAAYFIAGADFLLWLLITGDANAAFSTALAILAVVAPVALAISPALALRLGIEAAARNGILMRDGHTFRVLEATDTAVFNRVGALVKPEMFVETVTAERGEDSDIVLRVASVLAVESDSPMAKALVKAARESRDTRSKDAMLPTWIELSNEVDSADGEFSGRLTLTFEEDNGEEHTEVIDASLWRPTELSQLRGRLAVAATSGGTPIVVRWKGRDRGVITFYDPAKDDAIDAVERLEDLGVETVMLTRDTYPVARRFADFLGVTNVLAGVRAADKPGAVRALHTQGATVAMVGDHTMMEVLKVADVGILYANDKAIDSRLSKVEDNAEVVLLRDDVMAIPQLIALSRRVCGIIDANMLFAWAYNIVAIVLAVAGVLPPMGATLLMLGSTLIIEALSARARRFPL
ncbi:heavy metal translocating P-type ATPase [Corynebacterium liangguodongii]|uniref:Metal-transporting ATPase n=1 Tax=Corynebacterium liangguodongii TaxID=2079535 RepID=A0A2S0WBZ1_9CORY|nr:HAD family hydrolase [Corynebacterium liangguodongii]AWB83291.1 metal-transporting ATPase [Corynebacterium liangguodongii]PWC00619.1 metal-transporting ATPase [Corynebacterium liangguodongii]